jgi:alpha-glucoside transport system substrate-binding protein
VTYRPTKRFTAIVAGASAVALVLTACSSSSTSSGTSAASESSSVASSAASSGDAAGSAGTGAAAADGDFCEQIKSQWPDDMTGKQVNYYTGVTSATEEAQWRNSFKPFEECTGATIQWEGSNEFEAQIKVRIASGNPPDVAALPQPGLLKGIVEDTGTLVPVPQFTADNVKKYYSEATVGFGTVNDIYFATPIDANVKSFVWYSPTAFKAAGYEVPTTYDELVALSDKIVASGKKPWCAGISSGNATGWPVTDWLEDFVVRDNGPEVYQQWVNHEIPFNDPMIAASLAKVAKFLKNPDYVNGGYGDVATIASTTFQDGGLPITKGDCFLHRQANFYESFWPAGTKVAEDGDVYAFYLPTFNDKFGKPVLFAGTLLGAFAERPEVQAFQYYVTTPAWTNAYLAEGTNITANSGADPALIKSTIGQLSYEILQDPDAEVVFDASDQMPAEVGAGAEWKQFTAWISPGQDDATTLNNIEAAWPAG